jgi:hypothetical protein
MFPFSKVDCCSTNCRMAQENKEWVAEFFTAPELKLLNLNV